LDKRCAFSGTDDHFCATAWRSEVQLTSDWFGSPLGPSTDENPNDFGAKIIGDVVISGSLGTDPFWTCQRDCNSSVLFLPGIESSRLYVKDDPACTGSGCGENTLWEPNRNEDVRNLYLDESGKSLDPGIYTKSGDVVDKVFGVGQNIYSSFIGRMNTLRDTGRINDWSAIAYDWRLSLEDILNGGTKDGTRISYGQTSTDPYVIGELRRLAARSKTGKVTIVAHSNGGLVAKALLQTLGEAEAKRLVDKIIFVAVPQVGTPMGVAAMVDGYKQGYANGLILSESTSRGLAEHMPGAYNLLPSSKYFDSVDTPVVTFDTGSSNDWKNRYDTSIDSKVSLDSFLTDTFRRSSATNPDTGVPSALNGSLLSKANGVHESLDDWTAPDGMKIIQIAGWGVPSTVSGISFGVKNQKFCDVSLCTTAEYLQAKDPTFTIDGDGTVVTPSALWMKSAERYWVDIKKFNTNHVLSTGLGYFGPAHSNIFEIPQLDSYISDSITNSVSSLSDYTYIQTDVPQSNGKRLEYSLHSPLTLDLYDDQGRHTGINAKTKDVEEQIPGTYYRQFGEVKYIFADEGFANHISMSGYDVGAFTFRIDEFEGDTPVKSMTFRDMPTTSATKVGFDVPTDLSSASRLRIDTDGNGTDDYSIRPPEGGKDIVFDSSPPVTTLSPAGTQGANGWYVGNITVTLSSTDPESNVDKTEYSLDSGTTWSEYVKPIILVNEGKTTVRYRSTNTQGYREDTKSADVRIDKTQPELGIAFDPKTRQLAFSGTDSLSKTTVTTETLPFTPLKKGIGKIRSWFMEMWTIPRKPTSLLRVTSRDEAGHSTGITFEKGSDSDRRTDLSVRAVISDGAETAVTDTGLQYSWMLQKKTGTYAMFSGYARTASGTVESHYRPKQDMTLIMSKPQEIGDDTTDDISDSRPIRQRVQGMTIIGLKTESGKIVVKY